LNTFKNCTSGLCFKEDEIHIGYHPSGEKWKIERVGSVQIERFERDGETIVVVRYPGWKMISPDSPGPHGPSYVNTGSGEVMGPDIDPQNIRIGGWSLDELTEISALGRSNETD